MSTVGFSRWADCTIREILGYKTSGFNLIASKKGLKMLPGITNALSEGLYHRSVNYVWLIYLNWVKWNFLNRTALVQKVVECVEQSGAKLDSADTEPTFSSTSARFFGEIWEPPLTEEYSHGSEKAINSVELGSIIHSWYAPKVLSGRVDCTLGWARKPQSETSGR